MHVVLCSIQSPIDFALQYERDVSRAIKTINKCVKNLLIAWNDRWKHGYDGLKEERVHQRLDYYETLLRSVRDDLEMSQESLGKYPIEGLQKMGVLNFGRDFDATRSRAITLSQQIEQLKVTLIAERDFRSASHTLEEALIKTRDPWLAGDRLFPSPIKRDQLSKCLRVYQAHLTSVGEKLLFTQSQLENYSEAYRERYALDGPTIDAYQKVRSKAGQIFDALDLCRGFLSAAEGAFRHPTWPRGLDSISVSPLFMQMIKQVIERGLPTENRYAAEERLNAGISSRVTVFRLGETDIALKTGRYERNSLMLENEYAVHMALQTFKVSHIVELVFCYKPDRSRYEKHPFAKGYHLATRFCERDLFEYALQPSLTLDDRKQSIQIFAKMLHALHEMHERGYVYFDHCLENTFMQGREPHFGDFGHTGRVEMRRALKCRSETISPELQWGQSQGDIVTYCKAADVWALGVTFMTFLSQRRPFHDRFIESHDFYSQRKIDQCWQLLYHPGISEPILHKIDPDKSLFYPIFERIFVRDFRKRATTAELLAMPIIRG
ncbi:MAG: hypothetical protein K9M07_06170 [Simkaniaceae bacterium]|nr:hypothetical protein [Simkaniaceae bacterium]